MKLFSSNSTGRFMSEQLKPVINGEPQLFDVRWFDDVDVVFVFEVSVDCAQQLFKIVDCVKKKEQVAMEATSVANDLVILLNDVRIEAFEMSQQRLGEQMLTNAADELTKSEYDAIVYLVAIALFCQLAEYKDDKLKEAL